MLLFILSVSIFLSPFQHLVQSGLALMDAISPFFVKQNYIKLDEPTPEPTPKINPKPTPEPAPIKTPEPTPIKTPEPTPIQTPEPTPIKTPIKTPEPTPIKTPEPTPIKTPESTPIKTPEPTPIKTPEPTPIKTPEPTPIKTPEPTPIKTPEPTPIKTPEPTPIQTPEPTPIQTPEPTPIKTPEPTPIKTPEPTPIKTPKPRITPHPQTPPIDFGKKNEEINQLTTELNDYAIEEKPEIIKYDLPKETSMVGAGKHKKSLFAKSIRPNKGNLWCVPKQDASFTINLDGGESIIHSFTLVPGTNDLNASPQKISATIESKDSKFNYVFGGKIEKGEKQTFTFPYYVKASKITINVLENYGADDVCLENFDVYGPIDDF